MYVSSMHSESQWSDVYNANLKALCKKKTKPCATFPLCCVGIYAS